MELWKFSVHFIDENGNKRAVNTRALNEELAEIAIKEAFGDVRILKIESV